MSRPGLARPVVIKMDADIGEDIVRSKMRTLGISRNRFDELLSQVRGSKKPKRKKKNRCPFPRKHRALPCGWECTR